MKVDNPASFLECWMGLANLGTTFIVAAAEELSEEPREEAAVCGWAVHCRLLKVELDVGGVVGDVWDVNGVVRK